MKGGVQMGERTRDAVKTVAAMIVLAVGFSALFVALSFMIYGRVKWW